MGATRLFWVWMSVVAIVLSGCGDDLRKPSNQNVQNGIQKLVDLEGRYIKAFLIENNVSGVDEGTTVYGQKAYRIVYDSVDARGNPIKASGYMVVPTGLPDAVATQIGFSTVIDAHGTIFSNNDAPSVLPELTMMPGKDTSILFSSLGGFVTLIPDYVGYGESLGAVHPFVHKRLAEDTAAFYKAAKKAALEMGIKLNGQLFLTGYSEGGYVALATLEKFEAQGEPVALAVPMAGPYDLNRTAFGVLSQPRLGVPSFMAFVAYAYAHIYEEPIATVVNEPYASKLPELFDGTKSKEEIDAALTTKTTGTDGLFNPLFVQTFFTDPSNWLRNAVVQNSVHAWAPQTPVRLVHCRGDEVIPFGISEVTLATMRAMGAQDTALIPLEAALKRAGEGDGSLMGHSECALPAYATALRLFAQTRQETIGY